MGDSTSCSDGFALSHKAMICTLNKLYEGLTVYHFNARSLNGTKLDYFRYVFEQSTTDIICVTETWFNSNLPDNVYELHGFRLFRNDRVGRRGGGVAVFCRNSLNAKLLNASCDSPVEFVNIIISDQRTNVLVSCVYNPQSHNVLDPFFDDLAHRLVDFDHHIVCGDFNIDLLRNNTCTTALLSHSFSSGLSVVNCSIATRYNTNSTPSLLDLFLVSDLKYVTKFDQIGFVSDHDLIFCSLSLPLRRLNETCMFTYRDYRNINYELLYADLAQIRWADCHSFALVDDKLQWFTGNVMNIFEHHVPLRKKVISSDSCPWFTPPVLEAIKDRNKLRTKWRNSTTELNWRRFVHARKHANTVIKQAKYNYFQLQLHDGLTAKQLWSNLYKLKVVSKSNSDCTLQPDLLNKFFTNVPLADSVSGNSKFSCCEVEHPFRFIAVTPSMVESTVTNISSNAIGFDGMPIKFVKLCLPFLLSSITHIINHCFTTSTFPKLWKIATVTPVPKKSNASAPSDFRPISILPCLAKVCERLMAEQITDYLNKHSLLSPMQSGFRKAHSCTTAMLKIFEDLRKPLDNNLITLMCLLDFSKAFDSVNHDLLCNKLVNYFHFDSTSSRLIASFLSRRLQRVKVCSNFSDPRSITAGVPQGSTLGPILFSMFINDIFVCCTKVHMHAFADDVQLYLSGAKENVVELVTCLNNELTLINDWAINNMLLLNLAKSKILPIFNKRSNLAALPSITMGGVDLDIVVSTKNLGYIINSSLTSWDHINFVCNKVYSILRMLRYSSEYTSVNVRRNLALQLIMPHITYFSLIYSQLDSYSTNKLVLLFNNVTRYVFGLRKFDHISHFSELLLGVGIIDYLKIRNLVFLHQLLLNKTPQYLFDNVRWCQSSRSKQLIIPRHKHLAAGRFYFVNAIRLWNLLPLNVRTITSVSAFKASLYDLFANN